MTKPSPARSRTANWSDYSAALRKRGARLSGPDWPVPGCAPLCRRQKTRAVQIPRRRADGPLNLRADSPGIRFPGNGEGQTRKNGPQGRRQWRKVHPAMDTATSGIRAVKCIPERREVRPTQVR